MDAPLSPLSFAPTLRRLAWLLCAGAAFAAVAAPASAQGTIDRDAQTTYQREAAACRGQTRQDRATCMREAGAARDEARRGRLADRDAAYDRNATQRCNALPEADRRECLARLQSGTTSGSVDGGGVLREKVTRVPAPTPVPTQMPPPSPAADTRPGAPMN